MRKLFHPAVLIFAFVFGFGLWVAPSVRRENVQYATATAIAALTPATSTPIPTDTPLPTETPLPAETLPPTHTPLPTSTPQPTATPSLAQAITAALSDSNRGVERVTSISEVLDTLTVEWAINDNLTENMVRTGARMDAAKLLAAIHASGKQFGMINLTGSLSLVDAFGNKSEDPVVWITFTSDTMNRINWDDQQYVDYLLYQNIYIIADNVKLHPVMNEN